MTILLDERFEDVTDYDDASWIEFGGTSNTLDPNELSSNGGDPSGWGDECMEIVVGDVANNAAIRNDGFGALTKSFVRLETQIIADDWVASANNVGLLATGQEQDVGGAVHAWRLYWRKDVALGLHLLINMRYDDADHFFISAGLNADQRYIVEVEWDVDTRWSWRIDGVEQDFGSSFTSTHAEDIDRLFIGHIAGLSSAGITWTVLVDRVAIDDTTWPDTEGVKPHITAAYMRMNN